MTRAEAMRRVCAGAAPLLDNSSENRWLQQDPAGGELSAADQKRMFQAFEKLVASLRRRGRSAGEHPRA